VGGVRWMRWEGCGGRSVERVRWRAVEGAVEKALLSHRKE